jgi:hypothetical protein
MLIAAVGANLLKTGEPTQVTRADQLSG